MTEKMSPDSSAVLQEFLLHLQLGGRSDNTLETYERVLQRFFSEIPFPVAEVTSDHVLSWLASYRSSRKDTTISTWFNVLTSFFHFCEDEGHVPHTPIKKRWRPRLPQPLPRYLDKTEQAQTKLQVETESLRNQALYAFFVSSGCRVSEVCAINKTDIDLAERTVQVQGKGQKIRPVHFSERCAILLASYIPTLPDHEDALFVNQHGRRLTRVGVHQIISHMGSDAGLSASLGPHRLRHTFATTLLAKGADLSFISEELGHSSLDTTRIYARLPKEEIVTMYRKYMG
ncbi:tyrosine-type recombinase/integrase [Salibacterium qingdaonense]|uniref:Integrase/recombinase XerD n=1 Tax=Salibacterium qingdaonense TaxID=266892 RepID=A0A1I4Q0V6_9BACI|nr:tyrosine-type recombinase/integrase [Salibacterium qingdaonense]SFM33708.1 integrase/recombinase XerD [Salibacterium qingdaonense]